MITTNSAESPSIEPVSPPKSVPGIDHTGPLSAPASTPTARAEHHRAPAAVRTSAVQTLRRSGVAKTAAATAVRAISR